MIRVLTGSGVRMLRVLTTVIVDMFVVMRHVLMDTEGAKQEECHEDSR